MSENIFFDTAKLKKVGKNVIIGKTVRIRYPELVEIGDNCIIDDFTYISTQLVLGNNVHIGANCNIIGGQECNVSIGSFAGLSPNVTIVSSSDDYIGGLIGLNIPLEFKGNLYPSDIIMENHTVVGAGSTVLPKTIMREGSAAGAMALVSGELKEWHLYAGNPIKKRIKRNKEKILDLEQKYLNSLK